MNKNLTILNQHYKNFSEAAKALGITARYYRDLRNNRQVKPGKFLKLRIKSLVSEIVSKGRN